MMEYEGISLMDYLALPYGQYSEGMRERGKEFKLRSV